MEGGVLLTSPRIIHWPIDCNITAVRGWNPSFSILTMTDLSASESSLLLKGAGFVLALQVNGMASQGQRQEHGYRNTGRMDKFEGAEDLGYGAYRVQLRMLRQ
jgi:hypothetical protein